MTIETNASEASFDRLMAGLETSQERSGREFERLCKWLLENAPEYAARLSRVWLWADWPGNGGRIDAGIDVVAEARDGGLWAVQAKHLAPVNAIKKADIDSFLSESSRAEFSYRLLIATTDLLGPTARRTLDGQEKPVGTLLRSELGALDVIWPLSSAELRPGMAKAKTPRPHQRRAVREIRAGLESAERGQAVMACGTGKTLVARFVHAEMASTRTLVLVPSLSLLKQSLREWLAVGLFDYLAVCSDDTVMPDDRDAVISSTVELGVPVTTDPGEIASFLREDSGGVVFATYQSSPRIAAAQQAGEVPAFDLVVADEAHRCAGPAAGVFATVLDAEKIKARKRLFMTATPRYYTGRLRKEAREADWEIASMDDEARFGQVLHRLSFAQAIEQDLLSDYQVVVIGVTERSYREMAENGAFVTTDGETVTDARTLARQIGLLRAMRNHHLQRVVTFHNRVAGASRFAHALAALAAWMPAELRPKGVLWADSVSGKMTSGQRESRLTRLRAVDVGELGILTNARCLIEGVDVPTLDGVAFIDPRRSQMDIVQAVGRAIRRVEGKSVGTIVVPVFVDEDSDPVDALHASEFDRVWDVVRALRDHDEVLADELDHCRRELGRSGSVGETPRKIVLDLPLGVDVAFAHAFDSRLVDMTTRNWEFWYGLLERVAARDGTTRLRRKHLEDGHALGRWIMVQRRFKLLGRLPPERIARLERLPGWLWDAWSSDWDDSFSRLERFAAREGHLSVPNNHLEDGRPLGQWVINQRQAYARAELFPARKARLEALSGWEWNAMEARWDKGLAYLKDFAGREGHTRVPTPHLEDDFPLGQWVAWQRNAERLKRLPTERKARLEKLPGWDWNHQFDARWETGFSSLEDFAAREGHALVNAAHTEDGYRLGGWVNMQRHKYISNRLPSDRVARLEQVSGWDWKPLDAAWRDAFSYLERFAAREDHASVPPTPPGGRLPARQMGQQTTDRLRERQALARARQAARKRFRLGMEIVPCEGLKHALGEDEEPATLW